MSTSPDRARQRAPKLDAAGQLWLDALLRDIDEMPPKSAAERERSELLSRFAGALEDMSEVLPSGHPLLDEAMGWTNRSDLAELLDAWEAGGRLRAVRDEGLRVAVRSLCRVLSIPLDIEREAQIGRMVAADLDALRERLERDRRWD